MRKLYPGYDSFIKEQKPKYGQTFLEWYEANYKVGDVEFLPEIQKKSQFYVLAENWPGHVSLNQEYTYCFKDFFTKKLQLCQNIIGGMVQQPIAYDLNTVADIMDLYEDIIQEICLGDNIYVTFLPSGKTSTFAYATQSYMFQNLEELKEEFSSGTVIVYHFMILENGHINIRYFKREPLTRRVLVEK